MFQFSVEGIVTLIVLHFVSPSDARTRRGCQWHPKHLERPAVVLESHANRQKLRRRQPDSLARGLL